MVQTTILIGGFYGHNVLYILYHTKYGGITLGIGTYLANICIGDIMAHSAILHLVAQERKRFAQSRCGASILAQQMQYETQSRLPANTWQTRHLVYGTLQQV
jgi:hypothetical protein